MSTSTPQRHQQLEQQINDDASTPLRRYFSRKLKTTIRLRDLPTEPGYIGHYSAWGLINSLIFLTVPVVYIYIALILLRELCMAFPDSLYAGIQRYIPHLAWVVRNMQKSSLLVEVWCVIEGVFYILLKLQIQWLQLKDPLEASLSAAPMMNLTERALLWSRMMHDDETKNLEEFISGWFFDAPLDAISRYDVRDFLCWSLFEGRNQEHLTGEELQQLEGFLEELEDRLSYHIYGEAEDCDEISLQEQDKENDSNPNVVRVTVPDNGEKRKRMPKQGESSPTDY